MAPWQVAAADAELFSRTGAASGSCFPRLDQERAQHPALIGDAKFWTWRVGRNRQWRGDEVYDAWPSIGRPRDGRERDQPWRLPLSSWQYRRSVRDQWVVNPRLLARKVDQIRDHCDAPCVGASSARKARGRGWRHGLGGPKISKR